MEPKGILNHIWERNNKIIKKNINNDKERLEYILSHSKLPIIDQKEIIFDLKCLVSTIMERKINVSNIDINEVKKKEDPIDIDEYMRNNKVDVVFVHDSFLCYTCTFSAKISQLLYEKAVSDLGINVEISSDSITGLRKIGNSDPYQKNEQSVWTANFGIGERVQRKTKTTSRYYQTTKCHRGLYAKNTMNNFSLDMVISPFYTQNCLQYFKTCNLSSTDSWYSKRDNGKRERKPRFSTYRHTADKEKLKLPYILLSSLPKKNSVDMITAANLESNIRQVSEWFIQNIYCALPYGAFPIISSNNMKQTQNLSKVGNLLPFVLDQINRPLPKGSIGLQLTKPLHDDGNAAITPGVWTSLSNNPEVTLEFCCKQFKFRMKCYRRRTCTFYGWIPHKTFINQGDYASTGKFSDVYRLHHSAYSKPEIEHIGLLCLGNDNKRRNFCEGLNF